MSTLRTDDDTWDITTGVSTAAVMVAAARAAETDRPAPLICDPYAKLLVAHAANSIWKAVFDESIFAELRSTDPETSAYIDHVRNYVAVRTHYFDNFCADAIANGVRQLVLLASGLDSRSYRLDWPAGTTVYEIDQPFVLAHKSATLAAHDVKPAAERRQVRLDLSQDWPAELCNEGFDPTIPTAWLAEGLLIYLTADGQDRLLQQITALSPPGSWIAVETAASYAETRREELGEQFTKIAAELKLERAVYQKNLMYPGQDRAHVADWLNDHGWHATTRSFPDAMRRLGRWVERLSGVDDKDAFGDFVTAEFR